MNALSPPLVETFLSRIEPRHRGPVATLFYDVVRRGVKSAPEVLAQVRVEIHRRLRSGYTDEERCDALRILLRGFDEDEPEALAYVKSIFHRESLPYEERSRLKAARGLPYALQHMRGLPVTEKQLAFLDTLGYVGEPPTDRLEASELIDQLKKGGDR